jgi:peptidoglycan/LPS O-acetylase OafA/YrhL
MKIMKFRVISKSNSFDFIRLFLASFIVYAHSLRFGGYWHEPYFNINDQGYRYTTLGNICVYMFFAISGYFVTMSYVSSNSISIFLTKRIKRIYPAFWICLLITAFGIPPLILGARGENLFNYLYSYLGDSFVYLDLNLTGRIIEGSIGNILEGKPYPVLNGALWSIIYEIKIYLLTGFFGFFGILKKRLVILTLTTIWLSFYSLIVMNEEIFQAIHKLPEIATDVTLISYFLIGTCLFLWRDTVRYSITISAVLLPLIILAIHFNCLPLAAPCLVYVLFSFGVYLPFKDISNKFGDLSYGVYLYHWPVQIVLNEYGIYSANYWLYLVSCYVIVFFMAFISWNYIERRFISRQVKS